MGNRPYFDIQVAADHIASVYFQTHSPLPDQPQTELEHDCENIWTHLSGYFATGIITQDLVDWFAPCDKCLRQLLNHIRCGKKQSEYMSAHKNGRYGRDRQLMAAILKQQTSRAEQLLDLALQIIPDQMYTPRQIVEQ